MKRIIILAALICLVVSSLTVFAQGSLTIKPLTNTIENSLFTDTNENDWYYPHLEMLTNKKGIDGYPDGTFRPENNMSNAEFIKIVVALVSGEIPKGSAIGTHWADNYMNKAVELGLITQDENVVDRYDDPIIRQNMAKVVSRTMEKVFKEEKVADTSAYISKIVENAENKDKKLVNDTFADLIKKQGEKIDAQQTKLDVAEQQILDAFERGKMFGYAEGLRKAKVKLVSELTVKELQNLLKKQEK